MIPYKIRNSPDRILCGNVSFKLVMITLPGYPSVDSAKEHFLNIGINSDPIEAMHPETRA